MRHVRLLLRHELRRVNARLRRPSVALWLGAVLPVVLVAGLLAAAGPAARPDTGDVAGGGLLGFLIAAPVSFFAYGALYRGADRGFVHGLGIHSAALFVRGGTRLAVIGTGVLLLTLLPVLAAGEPLARPAAIGVGVLLAAWAAGLFATASAAHATVGSGGPAWMRANLGWDPELARAAPLLYAPLLPLVAGIGAGMWCAASPGMGWGRAAVIAPAALLIALPAASFFRRAQPRFAPRAREMSFTPPSESEAGLVTGRGLVRLLPERAAAVCARDGVVAARRFPWTRRIAWPVAIVTLVALGRWGQEPAVRGWIVAAGVLGLLAQAGAGLALGWLERGKLRWLDRAAGLAARTRFAGRWAWGFGLSMWLVLPVAVMWGLWSTVGGWWLWLVAGVVASGLAAAGSLAVAEGGVA